MNNFVKNIFVLVLSFITLTSLAFGESNEMPPMGMRPEMQEHRKEMMEQQVKREEHQLAMKKLKLKYKSASTDAEKSKIVEEAKTLIGKMMDDQKSGLKKRIEHQKEMIAKEEERLKNFDKDKNERISQAEEILKDSGPTGGFTGRGGRGHNAPMGGGFR